MTNRCCGPQNRPINDEPHFPLARELAQGLCEHGVGQRVGLEPQVMDETGEPLGSRLLVAA